jgi:3-oxoacyl-[acyl-carrier protein] reductase
MSRNIDLSGKRALITGAGAGIGRACAVALAEAGTSIVAVDVNEQGIRQTIDTTGSGFAVRCDLSRPDDVESMRDRVLTELGGVDILVNCAGIISYKKGIGSFPIEEWDRVLDVNLRGTYLVCRAFVEGMKEQHWGRIVTFSSLAARVGGIEVGLHYTASKAALIGFTRTLAKECGPYGITVNAVAPGVILTEPVRQQIQGREADYTAQIPLRRLGEPEDVADVVLFLSSPLSGYMTGSVLDINGGMYMG